MKYIENVVVGYSICSPESMFALDEEDWKNNEREKTYYTNERFLPQILVDLGIAKSKSEVKRNKPQYFAFLDKQDFIEIKWGKRKLWILIGKEELDEN